MLPHPLHPLRAVLRRSLMAVAVAALIVSSALALPVTAAPFATGIESPANGQRITRPDVISIVGFVDSPTTESVEKVEVRLLRDGQVYAGAQSMEFVNAEDVRAGVRRTRWKISVHPYNSTWVGGALPNGPITAQIRAFWTFGNMQQQVTEWFGHPFILDVDPPDTPVRTTVTDQIARTVKVEWDQARLPDFTRYVLQRATEEGDFEDLGQVSDQGRTSYTDRLPADGVYRYRIRVFRAAAGEGERGSQWSAPSVVNVAPPPPPPSFESGSEPASDGEGAAVDQQAPVVAPPRVTVRRAPAPRAPRPPDVYSETLDYRGIEAPEFADSETGEPGEPGPQAAARGGGLLEVEGREFLPERVVVPVAGGLLFTLGAWHVRRFLRA